MFLATNVPNKARCNLRQSKCNIPKPQIYICVSHKQHILKVACNKNDLPI